MENVFFGRFDFEFDVEIDVITGQSSFVNCSMNLTTMPLSEVMA